MKNCFIDVLLLVASLTITANAQTPTNSQRESMSLGSVQVHLGESKTEVLAALVGAGYTVNPFGEDKSQFRVDQKHGDNWSLIAIISFRDNRLIFINKTWELDDSSGYNLAKTIYFAAKNLVEQGCSSVELTTKSNDKSGFQVRQTILHCVGTHRRFQIDAYDVGSNEPGGKQNSPSLGEILQSSK